MNFCHKRQEKHEKEIMISKPSLSLPQRQQTRPHFGADMAVRAPAAWTPALFEVAVTAILFTCYVGSGADAVVGAIAPANAVAVVSPVSVEAVTTLDPVVIDRGAHHRVWQTVRQIQKGGRTLNLTNFYTEMSTGMNYKPPGQEDGPWLETKEEVELLPDCAVARQGPHQVIFAPNITAEGAVDWQIDGKRLRSP